MALLNRQELFDRLSVNECTVQFAKKNGILRTMRCTVDPQRFPNQFDVKEYFEKEHLFELQDEGCFNVWDLEAQGWRSFLIENVQWVLTHDD